MKTNPYPLMHHSDAAWDVLAERKRQVGSEGFDTSHDDEHTGGEMVAAAVCYAVYECPAFTDVEHQKEMDTITESKRHPWWCWPWAGDWWKPKNHRLNLVRAAALLIAEIERLDRCSPASGEVNGR